MVRLSKNIFGEVKSAKPVSAGNAGFDNTRENIDPHIKTKVLNSMEGTIEKVPVDNSDIVNKLALDTAIASVPGGGDVVAAIALTDEAVVVGDGGAKGIKTITPTSTQLVTLTDDSMADTLHRHSELSASDGTPNQALTVDATGRVNIFYDLIVDTDLLFVDVAPGRVGVGTNTPGEMLDVVGNAEVNGDIIVTGTVDGINVATDVAANTTHAADNTQAHSDYLLNSGVDVGVGLTLTGDNASADTAYVPMVLYNTDATPPAATTVPIGTLYVQYTA